MTVRDYEFGRASMASAQRRLITLYVVLVANFLTFPLASRTKFITKFSYRFLLISLDAKLKK